jgi:hypothetical protein
MTKVFFGGSRKMGQLNQAVRERIDNMIANEYFILLGDANGADKAVQKYLADKNYKNVLVFCVNDVCRNNIGMWEIRKVHIGRSKKDFDYYSTKDVLMSEEADYGFMLWNGKSKGTLNSILNLCERDKTALVYFSPTKSFHTIKNKKDLSKLLECCEPPALKKLSKHLGINCHNCLREQQLSFA